METEITMKAIVLFEPGNPLEVEELDFDPPQEDERFKKLSHVPRINNLRYWFNYWYW